MKENGLYNRIKNVLEDAFYDIFADVDGNWVSVDRIELDYQVIENRNDTPFVEVYASYKYTMNEEVVPFNFFFWLDKSDDFNAGYIRRIIERLDDGE